MRKCLLIPRAAVSVLLLAALPTSDIRAQSVGVTDDFSKINERIQGWVERGYYPGGDLFVAMNRRVLYEKYFGSYTPDSVVFIASAGKWLAAATIMSLVDEGKLLLDDPASKWLPEFKDAKGRATIRQMLSHTSGYPPYQPASEPPDKYQTLTESVQHILMLPPVAATGERFEYGGLAMQVAGRIAELAAKKDWETLFQKRIARPLRMTNTHFTPVDPDEGHSPMLGGGARSTVRDYANFLAMIANNGVFEGRRVLSKRAITVMQADQVGRAAVRRGEFVERVRGRMHNGIYGLGEWREMLDEQGRAVLISSPSWAGAYPWIDKQTGVYGVFLAHVNVEEARRDEFSGFYASPVLAMMVREVLARRSINGNPRKKAIPRSMK